MLQFGLPPDFPQMLPICWLLVALKDQVRIVQALMCEWGPVFVFDVRHVFLKVTLERHVDPTSDIIILS